MLRAIVVDDYIIMVATETKVVQQILEVVIYECIVVTATEKAGGVEQGAAGERRSLSVWTDAA